MARDRVERTVEEWRAIREDLDVAPAEVILRILLLGRSLEQRIARTLEPFGLQVWEFDVLATLRRQGSPYRLSSSALARSVVMTCSGMTHRVTRLAERGYVRRVACAEDRRSVFVELTEAGLACVDRAAECRARDGAALTAVLSDTERSQLLDMLRRLNAEVGGD